MPPKTIVIVSDRNDAKYGEIKVLDSPEQAERLIETFLDSGCEQERIRIFNGDELVPQISYKPVVSFGDEQPDDRDGEGAAEEDPGSTAGEAVAAGQWADSAGANQGGEFGAALPGSTREVIAVAGGMKGTIQFSSLFRPIGVAPTLREREPLMGRRRGVM